MARFWRDIGRFYEKSRSLWVAGLAIAATLIIYVLFQVTESNGAVALQRSFTVERFTRVLEGLGEDIGSLRDAIITLDFAFPIAYGVGLASLYALARGATSSRRDHVVWLLPLVAGGLDMIENLIHLAILDGVKAYYFGLAVPAVPVAIASTLAATKYLLIVISLLAMGWAAGRRKIWWAAVLAPVMAIGTGLSFIAG